MLHFRRFREFEAGKMLSVDCHGNIFILSIFTSKLETFCSLPETKAPVQPQGGKGDAAVHKHLPCLSRIRDDLNDDKYQNEP